MIELRPYQTAAVQSVYDYFATKDGNPLIVLPTGAGKSLTLAAFIRSAVESWPDTRVIVLTHVKELIKQDAQAIYRYWPEAPLGIWSAGLGKKTKHQVTVAGIQSIHRHPASFAGTDLVIIDEAHLLSKNSDTMYGRFIKGLQHYNPALKVIGLTATPYRLDSGLLTEGAARVFTDIAYEARVGDLILQGYLCPLVPKNGSARADLSGLHKRGGEFIDSELEAAFDKDDLVEGALNDFARYGAARNHILGFCSGVKHARHCAERARARGWAADYVTGEMAAGERDAKIADFVAGRVRFLFNANLLTTGFDAPHIDCIMLLRATESVGLYVQIMGRGLRKHPSKENTLVLDFGSNVERHGPIDQISVNGKRESDGSGVAPVKECPSCEALIATGLRICPECNYEFPEPKPKHATEASTAVVVAAIEKPRVYEVDRVEYERHHKRGTSVPTMKVTYYCGISTFNEWIPIEDERPFVRKHAVTWYWKRGLVCPNTVAEALNTAAAIPAPDRITAKLDGKYWRVTDCEMGSMRTDVSKVF